MNKPFSLLLVLVLSSSLCAQAVPPALMVQGEGRSVPLGLSKLQVAVRIFGSIAETTSTMTFTNPMPRVMEGDLYFPLPEGATISGYALDINGVMVDGAAVEKHEGRQVFEAVVRRGVDPGLVEWTKGNNFKTRVFPIPANGSRTIRVQYLAELIGGSDGPAYHLPLGFKEKLNEFSLRIEVVKPAAQPKVVKGKLANFAFAKWQDNFVAETKLDNASPAGDLVVALPQLEKQPVLVEKADDGQVYFAIHDFPASPRQKPVAAPKHVVIYWDASGSRGGDHQREIGLLKAYFKALGRGAAPAPTVNVDLVLFRNAASQPKRIVVARGDAGPLASELAKVRYDGGTQMAVIAPPKSRRPDFYMLFTDGISNFGKEEPAGLNAPLYIFSADAAANHSFLQGLALASGGRYFNLARLPDAEVLPAIGQAAYSFLSAAAEGGRATGIYPELPQPIAGRLTVVGKLTGNEAAVTLSYGIKGGVAQKRSFQVSRAGAAEGSLLRRLWAQKKLADLVIFPKRNEKEITALGKQFGMVTPYTSLIVLDSLDQYVEHEIAPPKSLAAMREEYMRRIDTIEHQKQKQKADKLLEVVRMWEQRVQWWNTEFKHSKDFKLGEAKEQAAGEGRRTNRSLPAADRAPADAMPSASEASPAERPASPAPPSAAPAPPAPRSLGMSAPAAFGRATAASDDRLQRIPAKAEGEPSDGSRQPGIVIKPWEPDTPYLKRLKAAEGKDLFAVYLKDRPQYGNSPAFFLDCADFFREAKQPELALQVLSNIAELQLEDAALLRVLGYRLQQLGYLDLAVQTFQQVLDLRPEEPQSYRDLALTLARRAAQTARMSQAASERASKNAGRSRADEDAVRADYARAIDLFIQVVLKRWDGRFAEIELIALEELNHILPKAKAAGVSDIPLDPRLLKLLDVDVRIVMTWQADATDIDLWVTEPSGEKAFYSHNRTIIGGLVSRDFTAGYGPEEYMVRRAMNGMYKIEANYYGSRATRLLGAVTVQVDVFTNYGRANEDHKSLTVRLKEAKETVAIGEIEF